MPRDAYRAAGLHTSFILVIPSLAGCGGTAPIRSKFCETVKQFTTGVQNWFNG